MFARAEWMTAGGLAFIVAHADAFLGPASIRIPTTSPHRLASGRPICATVLRLANEVGADDTQGGGEAVTAFRTPEEEEAFLDQWEKSQEDEDEIDDEMREWMKISEAYADDDYYNAIMRGQQFYQNGQLLEALKWLDATRQQAPELYPTLYPRAYALYYAKEYKAAAEQFRQCCNAGKDDAEFAIWTMLAEKELIGLDHAIKRMPAMPMEDVRPIAKAAWLLFAGQISPQQFAALGPPNVLPANFFVLFYLGLWADSRGLKKMAKEFLNKAINHPVNKVTECPDPNYFHAVWHAVTRNYIRLSELGEFVQPYAHKQIKNIIATRKQRKERKIKNKIY